MNILSVLFYKEFMNYLAHIYLSGENDDIKIGNFIGDSVKGKKYMEYDADIQTGILLHRQIDSFTDSHPVFKASSRIFRSSYGKYSGVVTDIVFDHFLSTNSLYFNKKTLKQFARSFYILLMKKHKILPSKVKKFAPFFISKDRLSNYASISGIQEVLHTMSKYTSLPEQSSAGIKDLKKNYNILSSNFELFFEDVKDFSAQYLQSN